MRKKLVTNLFRSLQNNIKYTVSIETNRKLLKERIINKFELELKMCISYGNILFHQYILTIKRWSETVFFY